MSDGFGRGPLPWMGRGEDVKHGETCRKVAHVDGGYEHGADDDRPYDVDGVTYCGRCHEYIPGEPTRRRRKGAGR